MSFELCKGFRFAQPFQSTADMCSDIDSRFLPAGFAKPRRREAIINDCLVCTQNPCVVFVFRFQIVCCLHGGVVAVAVAEHVYKQRKRDRRR